MKYYCDNCGAKVSDYARVCPKCGVELGEVEYDEDDYREDISGFSSKVITFIVIFALCYFGLSHYKEYAYGENLRLTYNAMIESGRECEKIATTIHDVWSNTIFQVESKDTDKYTRTNNGTGLFYEDFNDSLSNLYADESFSSKVQTAADNQQKVMDLFRKLNDPPKKYADTYSEIRKAYNSYITLSNLAINPSGTILSYTTDFNDADNELGKQLQIVYSYID